MPRDISEEIAENRQQIGRAFARNRRASTSQETTLTLSPVPVSVDATVEVYTRPINDTALVGHPDNGQGYTRGLVGDHRGAWTKQETVSTSLQRDGRQAIADALASGSPRLKRSSAGDDVVDAFGIDETTSSTVGTASFRFGETPATISTADVRTDDSRVIVEGSVTVSAGVQKEARIDATLSFADASRTNQEAVTGVDVVADAIRPTTANTTTIAEIALGSDDSNPTTGDTSLVAQEITKDAQALSQGPIAVGQTVIFRSEPGSQPVDFEEIAVVDSNGDLLTRVVFAKQTKDDKLRLRARNGVQIR